MLKRILFLALFLFLWPSDYLFSQVNTVPSTDVPTQFSRARAQNPPFFLVLSKDVPEKVFKVKEESIVAVLIGIPIIRPDRNVAEEAWYGAGFVVWENYVVTNLHLFGDYPAMWHGTKEFPTLSDIFDGQTFFTTQLAFSDYRADLALLKVNTPNTLGQNFTKKSAKLIKLDTKNNDTLESLASYENFYAFGPYVNSPSLFFILKLGPFRAITNSIDGGFLFPMPLGILQGSVQTGFSGGPLLTPRGEVAGVVTKTSNTNTFVTTTETINEFLINAAAYLGLDLKGKPLLQPNQVKK